MGIVALGFKTLKGFTLAGYRKEDVVSYAVIHCNNLKGPWYTGKSPKLKVRDQHNFTSYLIVEKLFKLSLIKKFNTYENKHL
jgi:hypothetical protein